MRVITRNGIDHLMYQLSNGGTAEIFDIVVHTERGRGIGTEMLDQAVKELHEFGIKRLFAFTRDSNSLAQKFYKKNGFNGTPISNFYPDGNAILFVREI